MPSILLIDDDADLRDEVSEGLAERGHTVECLEQPEAGPERLAGGGFDVVLLDNIMPRMTGIEFLKALRERGIEIPVILMTGESTPDTAIQATKLGAFDYVIKPDTYQKLVAEILPIIAHALDLTKPMKEVRVSPAPAAVAEVGLGLVGNKSKRMVPVYKLIGDFAETSNPVLILGETGTGKELVAQAFHTNSPRKGKPFVALNCSAISETLLDSELFGHEKAAFTGAEKLRKGKVEYASGGTLFLDEIGDMPLNLQAKLLRVLQEQEIERLGSNEKIRVDVRVLSATHRDLKHAIREGKFREDLFHRLNTVTVHLPPLRERLEDLPQLVEYFLGRAAEAAGRARPGVADATLERLRAYSWPGNVRELQNIIFRAFGVCRGQQVLPSHLDLPADSGNPTSTESEVLAGLHKAVTAAWDSGETNLWEFLRVRLEKELLKVALTRLGHVKTEVAERLGMNRGTVIKRMEEYGLGAG